MAKEALNIVGQEFGKLKVLSRAENGKHGKYRWKCHCSNCGNTIIVDGSDLKNNKIHSCGCIDERKFKNVQKKKKSVPMTENEKIEWDELYEYVRSEIMNMSSNQSLSRFMVIRLKGLLTGKFAENYNTKNLAKYSLRTVINTFKFCSMDIKRAVSKKSFNTDEYKFNYIMSIIEKNIRNIDERMKYTERKNEELRLIAMESFEHPAAEYTDVTGKCPAALNDLW